MLRGGFCKWLLVLAGALWLLCIDEAFASQRHQRRQATLNDEDSNENDEDGDHEQGNGFEFEGLKGHGGMFSAFNWTTAELARISMWHATAQHYKAAELVEEKLAAIPPEQNFPRAEFRSFLQKFQTPDVVRQMFNKKDVRRIRNLHRRHQVREINEIFYARLMQMEPLVRAEIMQYFTLPHRC